METTKKFVYTTENTFNGFVNDYEGKHLQSGTLIAPSGQKLILPKFGKSLLSGSGELIFVHSWEQASVTDRMYHDDKEVVRARMVMCYSRFLDSYALENIEGKYHREATLSYQYDNEIKEIACRITWILDFESRIFKCILGGNAYELTPKETDLLNKIRMQLNRS